jgi:type IV pilus biogenesis/stability protein PilW
MEITAFKERPRSMSTSYILTATPLSDLNPTILSPHDKNIQKPHGASPLSWLYFYLQRKEDIMKHVGLCAVVVCVFLAGCSHFSTRSRDQEKAKIHLQIAADHLSDREYAKAIEATQQALELDPSLTAAYNHLALIYMETKRYEKAENAFRKALDLQPDYPEVLNNLGVLFNRQEHFTQAIEFFEKALTFEKYATPENAMTNLGYAYYKTGNHQKAKFYHQKAMDLVPQFCLAAKNMGDVYAKEKNFGKASDYFNRALTNCPLYQESQYKLGLVLMKMGQKKIAKNHLENLIQKHKSGPYVERSSEVLKYLR